MQINHKIENEIVIIEILDTSFVKETKGQFLDHINSFLEDETINAIIIDMNKVQILNSLGIGIIAYTAGKLKSRDKRLGICSLNKRGLDLLALAMVDHMLFTSDTLEEVLENIQSKSVNK